MRNNIIKSLIAIFVLALPVSMTYAQEGKQEVSVNIAGGLSSLSYDANIGKRNNEAGSSFGIGYTYFFFDNLGLNTGVELASYKAKLKADNFNNVLHGLVDPSDNEKYDLYTSLQGYQEKQSAIYVNIPMMVQYQIGDVNKFYIQAGAKLGIPVKGKYESSASTTINKGFFHKTANWGETQEFMGFGTTQNYAYDEDLDFKVACILAAEAGMKWRLKDNLFLYTGAYVDYGVNDIVKGGHSNTFTKVEELPDALITRTNSALNSSIGYGSSKLTQQMTEKIRPISVGIKIKLALAL